MVAKFPVQSLDHMAHVRRDFQRFGWDNFCLPVRNLLREAG